MPTLHIPPYNIPLTNTSHKQADQVPSQDTMSHSLTISLLTILYEQKQYCNVRSKGGIILQVQISVY